MNSSPKPLIASSRERRAVASLIAVGAVLMFANAVIARSLARLLPGRAEVSSAGTAFPQFAEVMPAVIHRNGLMLVLTALVIVGCTAISRRWAGPCWAGPAAGAITVISTAVWIGWLATPHNAFPSNARIHWVDYLTDKSDNYFYAAGRLPHLLFYDAPPLWQALNAAILTALVIVVARQLGASWTLTVSFSLVVATSGNLLRFANSAEDVFINLALVFGVIAACLRRGPVVLGFALAALLLGRPQFAVIFPAVVAAELIASARSRRRPDRSSARYLVVVASVTAAGVLVCQVLFTLLGRRYFLANGNFVDIEELSNITPREIDGFTIFPLSGAYAFHLIWVLPAASLLLAIVGVVRARQFDLPTEVTIYFCGLSVLALVALHEVRPLLYFNVRYLTYMLPFILVMGWSAVVSFTGRAAQGPRHRLLVPAAAIAVLAPITVPADAVDLKRRLDRRPETELLDVRHDLRQLTAGEVVYVDFPAASSRNYVAYILRRPVGDVVLLDEAVGHLDGVIIAPAEGLPSGQDELIATERLVVYAVDQSGT